ncbi:hypothetical protein [Pseudonocardia acaciae]|uniref:hypothetical protein n=1 Tax=Pseudonocardia acaciae TaxID=551276 RepID=UPI00048A8528|nr:hypothetical protein [Pseudonocardia acaciae]
MNEHTDLRATLAAMPLLEPPADVVKDWHAALDRLPPPATATRRGGRRPVLAAALLAAAAVIALVSLSGLARPATGAAPLSLSRSDLPSAVAGLRAEAPGAPFDDPGRLNACLARLGAPGAVVLGSRSVRLDGEPGVLLALATPTPGRLRALVVTPDCATVLDDRPVGR